MTQRIAIIQFPGSNCERETILAVKRAGMQPVEFLWNEPAEKLADFHGFIIVGGFSYEDRSRSGVIAAMDPIMQGIKQQSKLGKPVLGICNGAQILVETGLVPGLPNETIGMALTDNKRMHDGKILGTGYYNAWIDMRLSNQHQLNAFTRHLTAKTILHVPVAHGEGRFVIPSGLLSEMQINGLCVFQYCDAEGKIIETFPVNPNGSVNNIAAVSNKAGNVMAMMPHPERTTTGDPIFQSMRDYIAEGYVIQVAPLHYQQRHHPIVQYAPEKNAHEILVELVITDNHAMSVENALRHHDFAVKIKRYIHWEIKCDNEAVLEKIKASGVLFNDRKETLVDSSAVSAPQSFLVRAKEDMVGQQKMQLLKNHFALNGIQSIRHSILYLFDTNPVPTEFTHILYNPYAHDCYYY